HVQGVAHCESKTRAALDVGRDGLGLDAAALVAVPHRAGCITGAAVPLGRLQRVLAALFGESARGKPRVAHGLTYAVFARLRAVDRRAGAAACAAVVDRSHDVGLAAVLLILVAVEEAGLGLGGLGFLSARARDEQKSSEARGNGSGAHAAVP